MGSREGKHISSATEARCRKRSDTALRGRRSAIDCSTSHSSCTQPAWSNTVQEPACLM